MGSDKVTSEIITNSENFTSTETAWCPGCGDFSILAALTEALNHMELKPEQVVLAGGIGQAAKTNQYINANGFSGLHGRALPAAVGIKLANDKLTVIVNTGDGDSYGEGGNHFIHNIRRNVDITHLVHDNQIYGLTKGQTSPTSDACEIGQTGACNMSAPFNPMLMAIAAGATFAARAFSGNRAHLTRMIEAAISHKGYAIIDILQPCVTFNKVNTHSYYSQRVYELDDTYECTNKLAAMEKSMEGGSKIPIGILYREKSSSYEEKRPRLFNGISVIDKPVNVNTVNQLIAQFI